MDLLSIIQLLAGVDIAAQIAMLQDSFLYTVLLWIILLIGDAGFGLPG